MNEISIRFAEKNDVDSIRVVYGDAYKENRDLGFPCSVESVSKGSLKNWIQKDRVWVAEIAGQIVGVVRLRDLEQNTPTLCRLGVIFTHSSPLICPKGSVYLGDIFPEIGG